MKILLIILLSFVTFINHAQQDLNSNERNYECDTLILKDGRVLSVKIVKQTTSKVLFRLCPSSQSETQILKRNDLKEIKYASNLRSQIRIFRDPIDSIKELVKSGIYETSISIQFNQMMGFEYYTPEFGRMFKSNYRDLYWSSIIKIGAESRRRHNVFKLDFIYLPKHLSTTTRQFLWADQLSQTNGQYSADVKFSIIGLKMAYNILALGEKKANILFGPFFQWDFTIYEKEYNHHQIETQKGVYYTPEPVKYENVTESFESFNMYNVSVNNFNVGIDVSFRFNIQKYFIEPGFTFAIRTNPIYYLEKSEDYPPEGAYPYQVFGLRFGYRLQRREIP